jgi:methyl-accepting chemotaxis protein
MHSISLKSKFSIIGFAVLAGVIILGVIGYTSIEKLLDLRRLNTVNQAIHYQMDLDMVHDGLYASVAMAVTAFKEGDADKVQEIKAQVEEFSTRGLEDINNLAKLDLDEKVAETAKSTIPRIEAYTNQAKLVLTLLEQDIKNNTNTYKPANNEFEKIFNELVDTLGNGANQISEWSAAIVEEGEQTAYEAEVAILITLVFSVALAIASQLLSRFTLFSPLGKLLKSAKLLSEQEYDEQVPYTHRKDEIGTMAKTLDALRISAGEAFKLKKMVDDLPLNIITADAHDEFKITYANNIAKDTLRSLQSYINVNPDTLIGTSIDVFHKDPARIRKLLQDPSNLPHTARIKVGPETIEQKVSAMTDKKGNYIGPVLAWNIVTKSEKLASDFEQSIGAVSNQIASNSSTLQERAFMLQSSIEELTSAATEISKRTHESLKIVKSSVAKGDDARKFMSGLSASAEKISGVVSLINSIAEKTNLLALNATIESARAGEAGKGFAVVANEVKNLANQTSEAITEISSQVHDMQTSTGQAFEAVKEMCDVIISVNQIATEIASTVEEQQAATSEIARNISGSDSRSSQDTTSVLSMATQLKDVSGHLKTECSGFLDNIKKI